MVSDGHSVWIEHLSMSSGILGGFSAGVVAVQAFVDAEAASQDGRNLAVFALHIKGVLNAAAATGSVFVGLLYSGPLLERMGQIIGKNEVGNWMERRGVLVAKFAARRIAFGALADVAVLTVAEAVSGLIGWLLIAQQVGELVILALADDPMHVWLTRCRFRKPVDAYRSLWGQATHDKTAGTPYANRDTEEQEFQKALHALIADAMAARDGLLNAARSAPRPAIQGVR
ncbi:hypothetical protein AWV80_30315 [Cupriavidus sp. UYMU48A]|nr:hypothetical protein AWV80_30315 [Cupriavidus sp. UYMU48A]